MRCFVVVSAVAGLLIGCFVLTVLQKPVQAAQLIGAKTVQEWQRQGSRQFVLIDVRTPSEYAQAHIVGARLLPLPDITTDAARDVLPQQKDYPIVVYCRSGNRSKAALRILSQMGYTQVYDLGGIQDWDGLIEK